MLDVGWGATVSPRANTSFYELAKGRHVPPVKCVTWRHPRRVDLCKNKQYIKAVQLFQTSGVAILINKRAATTLSIVTYAGPLWTVYYIPKY